mgnify:CR=1 FL=1
MKVMVCLKQVPHQDSRLDVNADGTWIQDSNIKFEIKKSKMRSFCLQAIVEVFDSTFITVGEIRNA